MSRFGPHPQTIEQKIKATDEFMKDIGFDLDLGCYCAFFIYSPLCGDEEHELARVNMETMLTRLKEAHCKPGTHYEATGFNHYTYRNYNVLLIRVISPKGNRLKTWAMVEELIEDLDDYPILDEEAYEADRSARWDESCDPKTGWAHSDATSIAEKYLKNKYPDYDIQDELDFEQVLSHGWHTRIGIYTEEEFYHWAREGSWRNAEPDKEFHRILDEAAEEWMEINIPGYYEEREQKRQLQAAKDATAPLFDLDLLTEG